MADNAVLMRPKAGALRRDAGLYGYERALARRGLAPVAGADEAGRGACAGPLVVAAVVLPQGRRGQVPGLADSKLLSPAAREEVYAEIVHRAMAHSVVVIPPGEVDRCGVHVSNVRGMRRALAQLLVEPRYMLTDGFPVSGLGMPGLAIWKGDQVAACVAAASVIAKVTRDRMMVTLHDRYPAYDFAAHKGYVTVRHAEALNAYGPCPEHRYSYVNVARAATTGELTVADLEFGDDDASLGIDTEQMSDARAIGEDPLASSTWRAGGEVNENNHGERTRGRGQLTAVSDKAQVAEGRVRR